MAFADKHCGVGQGLCRDPGCDVRADTLVLARRMIHGREIAGQRAGCGIVNGDARALGPARIRQRPRHRDLIADQNDTGDAAPRRSDRGMGHARVCALAERNGGGPPVDTAGGPRKDGFKRMQGRGDQPAMSAALMPATATGFFIASRRNGSPSSWLIIASISVVLPAF